MLSRSYPLVLTLAALAGSAWSADLNVDGTLTAGVPNLGNPGGAASGGLVVSGIAPTAPALGTTRVGGGLVWSAGNIRSDGMIQGSSSQFTTSDVSATGYALPVVIDHNSTGTPLAGFGVGLQFQSKSDTTTGQGLGRITAEWVSPTQATRKSRMSLWAGDAGAFREGLRVESNGSMANVSVINTLSAGGPITATGGLTVGGAPGFLGKAAAQQNLADGTATFAATTAGVAQGERSAYALYGTFTGTSDNGPRRVADIVGGFTGVWGGEYLSINVGSNGAANDARAVTNEKMRITSAGVVTINGPVVSKDGANFGLAVDGSSNVGGGGNILLIGSGATTPNKFLRAHRGTFQIIDNAYQNPLVTLLDNGSLGVGTIVPAAKLHVAGNGYNGGQAIFSTTGSGNGVYIRGDDGPAVNDTAWVSLSRNNGTAEYYIGLMGQASGDTGSLRIVQNTSGTYNERMRINSVGVVSIPISGKLLVGTQVVNASAASTDVLQVNGGIYAKKLTVAITGFPDYVFADTYQLKPLSMVEAFIKENRHLPGVPSEAQVVREGLSVDGMIKQQMEKIEELTLYAISQDKELAAQRAATAAARREASEAKCQLADVMRRIEALEQK